MPVFVGNDARQPQFWPFLVGHPTVVQPKLGEDGVNHLANVSKRLVVIIHLTTVFRFVADSRLLDDRL